MELTMVQQLIVWIPNLWVAIFMLWYFMRRDEKKDAQFQENLKQFVELQKESFWLQRDSNVIHSKTSDVLNTVVVKLNDMHNDVKASKCKKAD